jgi:hypothetical protein
VGIGSQGLVISAPAGLGATHSDGHIALREISIVFAALGGWLWLNDGFRAVRTIAAVLIGGGRLIITLAGE